MLRKFRNLNLVFNTDPTDPTGGGDETPPADPAPADPPQPPADPAPADPAPSDPPADPAPTETFSREYVEKLRRENAAAREKHKSELAEAVEKAKTEFAQSIGKAIGLVKDDNPPDPDALVAQAEAERQKALNDAASTKRELAVVRAADRLDAKVDELMDSSAFGAKLQKIDLDADDFASQVDALITSTVDANPTRFKRTQMAAAAGGGSHTGEGAVQLSREQLAALPPAERLKAAKEGRLSSLINPTK